LFPVISCRVSSFAPPILGSGLSSWTASLHFSTEMLHFPPPSYFIFIYWFIFAVF
jgi:hypothetical protein